MQIYHNHSIKTCSENIGKTYTAFAVQQFSQIFWWKWQYPHNSWIGYN